MSRAIKKKSILLFYVALFIMALQAITGYADTNGTPSINPQNTSSASPSDFMSALQSLGLGSNGNIGPVVIGGRYDSLLGAIVDAHYARSVGDNFALGLLGEYGPNTYRLNGTVGAQLWRGGQVKLTGEYLSQMLPFVFDSGTVDERLGQGALGFELRQEIHNTFLRNLLVGGYGAKAPDVSLATETFSSGGLSYSNERNIAGATSEGFNIGGEMTLTPSTLLIPKLYYDSVDYHTRLTSNDTYNEARVGAGIEIEQILSSQAKVSLKGETRAIYDSYGGQFSWRPAALQPLGMEISLFSERIVSGNATPNSNQFGLNIAFSFDDNAQGYALPTAEKQGALLSWVEEPAVRMERVQAVAEQRTTLVAPTTSGPITPASGTTAGGTAVTLTGTNFVSGMTVTFGGISATSVIVNSPTTATVVTPAHAAGIVNVVITTPGGSTTLPNSFTYATPTPTVTSVSPASGTSSGGTSVAITGTNFTGATAVTFGSTAAASFVVNSATSITATSPAGTGTADITVTTPSGTSATSSADQFTYAVHIIFVTTDTYTGNLGGFSGANIKCNSDPGKPGGFASGYTYVALLNGNNATTSGVSYYRADGTTLIATATGGNLVGLSPLTHSIDASGSLTVWTGANGNSCSNWTSTTTTGDRGAASSSTTQYWFAGTSTCSTARTLYCVSQ